MTRTHGNVRRLLFCTPSQPDPLYVCRATALGATWIAVTYGEGCYEHYCPVNEYSQPVLYSHFSGKDAIVRAVALEGFTQLATTLRDARHAARSPRPALLALARAYLEFAHTQPALYDAMFSLAELPFAKPDTPAPLHEGFAELRQALAPFARARNVETLAEVVWSTLHGLATLSRTHRLRPDQRLALLVRTATTSARRAS